MKKKVKITYYLSTRDSIITVNFLVYILLNVFHICSRYAFKNIQT